MTEKKRNQPEQTTSSSSSHENENNDIEEIHSPKRFKHSYVKQLYQIVLKGNVEELSDLLVHLTVDEVDSVLENGWTALSIAVASAHVSIIKILIDFGCDVEKVVQNTTAPQIALDKFFATGRAMYLLIFDLLNKLPPNDIDEYKKTQLFLEHPNNILAAKIQDSIRHLTEKTCQAQGCQKKVIVPYDFCGGRSECFGRHPIPAKTDFVIPCLSFPSLSFSSDSIDMSSFSSFQSSSSLFDDEFEPMPDFTNSFFHFDTDSGCDSPQKQVTQIFV